MYSRQTVRGYNGWEALRASHAAATSHRSPRTAPIGANIAATPRLRQILRELEAQFVATLLNLPAQDSGSDAMGRHRTS